MLFRYILYYVICFDLNSPVVEVLIQKKIHFSDFLLQHDEYNIYTRDEYMYTQFVWYFLYCILSESNLNLLKIKLLVPSKRELPSLLR